MRRGYFTGLAACAALTAGVLASAGSMAAAQAPAAQAPTPPPAVAPMVPPSFVLDLTTPEGASAVGVQWKNMDAKIVEVPAIPNIGPAWKTTYDVQPKAGETGFDDSAWPTLEPKALLDRRGGGHLCMSWFRATATIPAKLGSFDAVGARAALIVTVDDYAEVWVNGQMPRAVGRPSPGTIQGFNMPNRVMLSESLKAGDKFQIAIMAINGPISVAPANQLFVREARIEFFR